MKVLFKEMKILFRKKKVLCRKIKVLFRKMRFFSIVKIWMGLVGLIAVTYFCLGCSYMGKYIGTNLGKNIGKENGSPHGGKVNHQAFLPGEAALQKFQKGLKHMDKEEYKKAVKAFRSLLAKHPDSQLELLALYNVGSAYEGLAKCKTAARYFKKAVQVSRRKELSKIEVQSLLRLSYAYECLRKDERVVTSLMGALQKVEFFPKEVGKAEIPARLGAAYLRLGNKKMARHFFSKAEEGLRSLRNKKTDPYKQKELFAKTLFLMGKVNQRALFFQGRRPSKRSVGALDHQQLYLLRAVEFDSKIWSNRALHHLIEVYDGLWEEANKKPSENLSQQQIRKHLIVQTKMVQRVLSCLQNLKKGRIWEIGKSPWVTNLFTILGQHERKFVAYLKQTKQSTKTK